ncbi:MAG: phenylalanine--tRNA ligase subunit beta [Planctomycetales bacterium]|nr:phenylalanine--tRNA ligase subunit beta [Planctomycetales bacterium]
MIVSWNWLKEYVRLDIAVDTLTERLLMSGLNLESVSDVEGDMAIDLEVTSNRPDCLGHLGIAREVGTLFDREVKLPAAEPVAKGAETSRVTSVGIECLDHCPQYIARVVRGVKVGPSPLWMQRRLTTLGIRPVNNIVDITNYVLMECGQPLHAFDFDKLHGGRIVVRPARRGEKIVAIDGREYELSPEMCIIADADHPVAVAGVMGGKETEIAAETTNVLIEVAEFAPRSIRANARKLGLHSDSSYRFERGVDRHNLDWAGRRCAQLILELAGGELCAGSVFAGTVPAPITQPVRLRFAQLPRILGIDVPKSDVINILTKLGLKQVGNATAEHCEWLPPTWRRDLTREIDLIEEVARIHGYEKIPEDVPVPLTVSSRTLRDRVTDRVHDTLNANGFFESITLTFVQGEWIDLFRPWTNSPPLSVDHSSRRLENTLRQSVIPSLLAGRRENEKHGNFDARLYEIARIYLSADEPGKPENEPLVIGLVTGQSFAELKGVVTALAQTVNPAVDITVKPTDRAEFIPGRGCEVWLNGRRWGFCGELADAVRAKLDLHDPVSAAELDLALLESSADLSPKLAPIPTFPAIERDINFVLDEAVTWGELADAIRIAAGPLLESVVYVSQYRGPQIPPNRKSYVVRMSYRAADRTLISQDADAALRHVVNECKKKLDAHVPGSVVS